MNIKFYIFISLFIVQFPLFAQEMLTPKEAVALALENNYGIKLVETDVEIAKNNANILNSGYLPSVTGNAGASYDKNNIDGKTQNGPIDEDGVESSRYNASVDLNYVLFDGLGRSYNYKQLQGAEQLTELQARETIELTILQLFTVYYNVTELTENIKSLNQTLEVSKDRLQRAVYQFDYGQNTKLEVLSAEVDVNNDSITVMNTQQQLRNFKRDLNLVLGNILPESFDVDTFVSFNNIYNKSDLLEKTIANNVNLLQIDKNIDITTFGVKAEKSAYLPTVGLVGSYGWNRSITPANFATQITSSGLSGGLNLRWNLFDSGNTITRVKNAKINLEAQEIRKEEVLVTLERDFNNAWGNYQNRLEIYYLQEDNIKTSQNNFDRTQEKFRLGQVSFVEFRLAQVNLLNAEINRNRAKYFAKIAELEMLQISGELLNINF